MASGEAYMLAELLLCDSYYRRSVSGPRISRKAIKCGNAIRHDEKYVFAQTDEQNVIHPTRERERD